MRLPDGSASDRLGWVEEVGAEAITLVGPLDPTRPQLDQPGALDLARLGTTATAEEITTQLRTVSAPVSW